MAMLVIPLVMSLCVMGLFTITYNLYKEGWFDTEPWWSVAFFVFAFIGILYLSFQIVKTTL